MAKYDYRCPACEEVSEHEHLMSETPELTCRGDGTRLERYFGKPMDFVLKGFGWYSVDSRIIHRASDVHGGGLP